MKYFGLLVALLTISVRAAPQPEAEPELEKRQTCVYTDSLTGIVSSLLHIAQNKICIDKDRATMEHVWIMIDAPIYATSIRAEMAVCTTRVYYVAIYATNIEPD